MVLDVILPDFNSLFRFFVQLIAFFHVESFIESIYIDQRTETSEVARRMRVGLHLVDHVFLTG